jgi:hypothetical protein
VVGGDLKHRRRRFERLLAHFAGLRTFFDNLEAYTSVMSPGR